MLMASSEPNFWGEVFPSYLGAVGGIASAVVAAVAFILGLRTKRSVSSVKEALEPNTDVALEPAAAPANPRAFEVPAVSGQAAAPAAPEEGEDEGIGEPIAHGYLAGPNPPASEPWSVMRNLRADTGNDLSIGNASDAVLRLIGIELFNGREWIPSFLPKASDVRPGEVRFFNFKVLGGRPSNINVVQVVWIDDDDTIRNQRVLL